jgi:hypothetical protein
LQRNNRRPPVRSLSGTTGHAWLAQVELPAPFRSTLNGRLAVEAEAARQIEGCEKEAKMRLGRKLAARVRAMAIRREDFVVNRLVWRAAAAA